MIRTLLIIDDEPNMRWVLTQALEQAGYTVRSAVDGHEGLSLLGRERIDLVILDLKLRGEDGLHLLRRLREQRPEVLVLMLTAYATVPTAVEAMQLGAVDVLRKPFDVEEVIFKIARALERHALQQELVRLKLLSQTAPAFDALVGTAPLWHQLLHQAQQIAGTDHHVLLWGEPGTGRRTLARAIHIGGRHNAAPCIEVSFSAYHPTAHRAILFGDTIQSGAWNDAGSGSLLLTEVEHAPAIHPLLLEQLTSVPSRSGPRLLVVTDGQTLPEALITKFPAQLHVPPLRERAVDIHLLARHFAGQQPLSAPAVRALEQYTWPGNLAELRSVIERAGQLAGPAPIDVQHLPDAISASLPPRVAPLGQLPAEGISLEQLEQSLIQQALERTHGNKSKAAELLGLSRHTLLYRLEKYGIVGPERV